LCFRSVLAGKGEEDEKNHSGLYPVLLEVDPMLCLKPLTPYLASALLLAVLIGCKAKEQEDPRTLPELVRTATIERSADGSREYTGVVTARVESDLGFRVSGKVTERFVDTGQVVRMGQPLMRIDVTDYQHAITTQVQTVEAARSRADQAVADEVRYRGLVSTGAVSASTYDQIKATADTAKAQLQAVEAQAKLAQDEGDYTFLVADSDGTVVETLAEPGQVVAAGQTVVKLAHAGPREASIDLPETVRPVLGSVARAQLYGQTNSVPARLRQLSDAADPTTRTFEARYVLGGADANGPLGATVTIRLPITDEPHGLEIPSSAITDRGKGPGVWVLDSKTSTVSFHTVTILQMNEEEASLEGIPSGEQIVSMGAHLLQEGQKVRVADEKAATQ
jgi:RND family efflux transporter MFP subunit